MATPLDCCDDGLAADADSMTGYPTEFAIVRKAVELSLSHPGVDEIAQRTNIEGLKLTRIIQMLIKLGEIVKTPGNDYRLTGTKQRHAGNCYPSLKRNDVVNWRSSADCIGCGHPFPATGNNRAKQYCSWACYKQSVAAGGSS